MLNFIILILLIYYIYKLKKRIDNISRITSNIFIDDLDDAFWEE